MTGTPTDGLAREEPLASVAYCHDGSLEGLLSAVFEAYARREDPQDIAPEGALQMRLGQSVRFIETDQSRAERVRKGIVRACGKAGFAKVAQASLADSPQAGTTVYRFVRRAMAQAASGKNALAETAHPAVEPLLGLARAVANERHRLLQFLRFEHLENDLWFARCNPRASVVPLVMDWFSGRFNTQPFVIFDETHRLAGVYGGREWHLAKTEDVSPPALAQEERLMQLAWKRFYDTVAIEARYNPELRRQFMPKRFWKHLTEMREELPGKGVARAADEKATRSENGCDPGIRPSEREKPAFKATRARQAEATPLPRKDNLRLRASQPETPAGGPTPPSNRTEE